MTLRKSNAAVKESVNNHLFEETFPDDSIKVSPVVKLAECTFSCWSVYNYLWKCMQYLALK